MGVLLPEHNPFRDLLGADGRDDSRRGQNVNEYIRTLPVEDLDDLALHVDVARGSKHVRDRRRLYFLLD